MWWGFVMELKVTHRVNSHHTNPGYRCLLIKLLGDPTFHYRVHNNRLVRADLMPTTPLLLNWLG